MRVPLTSPGTGDQGEAVECFRTKSANSGLCPPVTARNKDEVMNCLEKGSTSDQRIDVGYRMPGTEIRASAHRHRSAGAHLTHLLDHESPPGPRRPPESSPPVAGGSSSASKERASRLPADTSWSRAAVRRLAAGWSRAVAPARHASAVFLVVVAVLMAVSTAAQTPTYVFVSNSTQPTSGTSDPYQAQSFTTGPYDAGATITQVRLWLVTVDGRSTRVTIRENNASNEPGDLVATLMNPGFSVDAWNTFYAPSGMTLDASTTYWITVNEGVASDRVSFKQTTGDGEYGNTTGWSIGNSRLSRNDETADWISRPAALYLEVRGPPPTSVTIEPNHPSIGAGIEDLVFTLTRTGATTDELVATVTIVQDQFWLDTSDLSHTVTFAAGSPTATLTLNASSFSFAPDTAGELTATVTGAGISGGSDTVAVISTSEPPITISYDMSDYTFAENGNGRCRLPGGDARCGLSQGAVA